MRNDVIKRDYMNVVQWQREMEKHILGGALGVMDFLWGHIMA